MGYEAYTLGMSWGARGGLRNDEMTHPEISGINILIDSRSDMPYTYALSCDKKWLTFDTSSPIISSQQKITATCNREMLAGEETAHVTLDFTFKDSETKRVLLEITAANHPPQPAGTYIFAQNYLCIPAEKKTENTPVGAGEWRVVPSLGRSGNAIKSFPATKDWAGEQTRPQVRYDFTLPTAGEYEMTFYLSPRNPRIKGGKINAAYRINQLDTVTFNTLADDYITEHHKDWRNGVLNNLRTKTVTVNFNAGVNHLYFLASDPNVLLEHIVIYPKGKPPAVTHLAPKESFRS
jgi:hypothetical protein